MFAPRREVVEYSPPVLIVAGMEVGVHHQTGDVEVKRNITPRTSLVKHLEQAVLVLWVQEVGKFVERRNVLPGESVTPSAVVGAITVVDILRGVAVIRPRAPILRSVDELPFSVVVVGVGVAEVEARELLRPFDHRVVIWVR